MTEDKPKPFKRIKPGKNTVQIKPSKPFEATKTELNEMLRKAVENTK